MIASEFGLAGNLPRLIKAGRRRQRRD